MQLFDIVSLCEYDSYPAETFVALQDD